MVATIRLTTVVLLIAIAAPAAAQIDPSWDHQKAYLLQNAPAISISLRLRDRFADVTTDATALSWFSAPAARTLLDNGQTWPIHDARTHYLWWRIGQDAIDATVHTLDPLGPQTLRIERAHFLVSPALAGDVFGEPVGGNHYKAYDVQGSQVNHEVTIDDENGTWTGTVTYPFFFLTPVEEELTATGQVNPIEDATRCFVCYQVEPPVTTSDHAFVRDAFFLGQIQFFQAKLLCMPAVVTSPSATALSTWGRMKRLYR